MMHDKYETLFLFVLHIVSLDIPEFRRSLRFMNLYFYLKDH
jgi:hypothetical protein